MDIFLSFLTFYRVNDQQIIIIYCRSGWFNVKCSFVCLFLDFMNEFNFVHVVFFLFNPEYKTVIISDTHCKRNKISKKTERTKESTDDVWHVRECDSQVQHDTQ